jgi:hypothetical protein
MWPASFGHYTGRRTLCSALNYTDVTEYTPTGFKHVHVPHRLTVHLMLGLQLLHGYVPLVTVQQQKAGTVEGFSYQSVLQPLLSI